MLACRPGRSAGCGPGCGIASGNGLFGSTSHRQAESECRTFPNGCFRPDSAPVALDDPLYDRQPDAGAFEFIGPVQALPDSKQLARIAHVEPRAVVTDAVETLVLLLPSVDFDDGPSAGFPFP